MAVPPSAMDGTTTTPSLVHKGPTSISSHHPGVCPLDLAVTTLEGVKGINFTIIGTPHLCNCYRSGHHNHPLSH
eukprot:15280475-Ditylum_brightwellii.AAC.1